jgi:hypothetical protein
VRKLIALLFVTTTATRLVAEPVVSESEFVEIDHLKVQRRAHGLFGAEPTHPKSLVSGGRIG